MSRRSDNPASDYKLIMDLHVTLQGIASSLTTISNEMDNHNRSLTDMRIAISKCQIESRASRENNLYSVLKDVIKALLIMIVVLAGGAKVSGIW